MKKVYDHKALAITIKQIIRKEHLYRDIHFSREGLAKRLDISQARVSIIFTEAIGTSFYDFVNLQRVHHAHKLLRDGKHNDLSLEDIAIMSGFTCRMTLHRMYLKTYGITPGEERKAFLKEPISAKKSLS